MRKDIKINVDTQTDGISLSSRRLGISSENLQGKIIFTPKPFIDGICRMYIEGHGTIEMNKQEDCYTLDIKSSLLITPSIDVCFKITEPEQDNGVPIYATKIIHFEVLDTIESNEPIPEQYPQWKDVLDNYVEEKKGELDTYTTEMQTDLKAYKKDLEDEMSTTKDTLTGEITATATDETNKFNTNAESKTNAFNDNATEKTTNYNTNAETKIKEYNDNATTKTEEYNTNATNKVNEFNNNVDSLENELTELASQMPWNTTEIQDSIHIEDSAKYSRNKLGLFGNLVQEVSETGNNIFDGIMELGTIDNGTGEELNSTTIIRSKNYLDISELTQIRVVRSDGYVGKDYYVGLRFYDADKNFLKYSTTSLGNSMTLSTETGIEGYKYLRFVITNTTDLTLKYGINKDASEIYEDYIPNKPSIEYPSMPVVATGVQKIRKCGKNECKITSVTGYTYVNGLPRATGEITINQFDTNTLTITSIENAYRIALTNIIQLLPNTTYTISYKRTNSMVAGSPRRYIYSYNEIDGYTAINILNSTDNGDMSYTFNTGENGTIALAWGFDNTAKGSSSVISNIQIEQSNTPTAYEPYTEETFNLDLGTTELCKIVDENNNVVAQDRVVYKDGKWQFEKNTYRRTLNENDNWQVSGNKYTTFYVSSSGYPTPYNTGGNCNYFKWYKSIWQLDEVGYDMDSTNIRFNLSSKAKMTTIDEWKNWLKEHNLEIYYPRRTTIYEDCTPAQSQVLDKLYKLSLQQGTNNIYVESENGVTTELQLTYMQDLMSQINELKQAMLNIGGN